MVRAKGFQQLPGYDEALENILDLVEALPTETVPIEAARGRVVRQDIHADRDQPPFDRSAMDGFAVPSAAVKPGVAFPVIGSVAAGQPPAAGNSAPADAGVLRIATGAAVPSGYDAVVPIEQAEVADKDGAPTVRFSVDEVGPWKNIHRRSSDAAAGDVAIHRGTLLRPQHVGIAAAVGIATLRVTARPRITMLNTGDELRPPSTATADLQPQQIRNSNGPMLSALLEGLDTPLGHQAHLADDADATLNGARAALEESDLVLTTGGVSVGVKDMLPDAWQKLGLQTVLHGVGIQPGKPLFVARSTGPDLKLVMGLPGNPVSVLATALLFVWPVLRRLSGLPPELPWHAVRLSASVKASAKRQVFRAARWVGDARTEVEVIPWQGSGDLVHTASADGLVRLPLQDEPADAGTELLFLPLGH